MPKYNSSSGLPYPSGAKLDDKGVNFVVFSRHASSMELLLYERGDSPEPFQAIRLEPEINRTFFLWHVHVEGLQTGVHYTWRVYGPDDAARSGLRFDPDKELLDPWARAVNHELWNREQVSQPGPTRNASMRGIVSTLR